MCMSRLLRSFDAAVTLGLCGVRMRTACILCSVRDAVLLVRGLVHSACLCCVAEKLGGVQFEGSCFHS